MKYGSIQSRVAKTTTHGPNCFLPLSYIPEWCNDKVFAEGYVWPVQSVSTTYTVQTRYCVLDLCVSYLCVLVCVLCLCFRNRLIVFRNS